jgi:hypothetical protein
MERACHETHARVRVTGTVRSTDGSAVVGACVSLALRDVSGDTPLEQHVSDLRGEFSFLVDRGHLGRECRERALVVQALGEEGDVFDEAVLLNPPLEVTLELFAPGTAGVPRAQAVRDSLDEQLRGRTLAALSSEQLAFVAASGRHDPVLIAHLAQADSLAAEIGLDHNVAYSLVHSGLPADAAALLSHDDDVIISALDRAHQTGAIGAMPPAKETIALLRGARARMALKPAPTEKVSSLSALLGTHLDGEKQQLRFLELALEHQGHPGEFWARATADLDLSENCVREIQDTFHVAAIIGGEPDLVAAVQRSFGGPEGLGKRVVRPVDLATADEKKWQVALSELAAPEWISGADDVARHQIWASQLAQRAERDFPVEAIRARLSTSSFERAHDLMEELRTVDAQSLRSPLGLDAADSDLTTVKRLYALTGRATDTIALMQSGLTSAMQIASSTREAFMSAHADSFVSGAGELHDRASRLAAQVSAVISRYHDAFQTPVAAVPEPTASTALPAWKDLFGRLDLCACSECRSVDGPAAYLVDVFAMLRAAPGLPGKTALNELDKRRPDLLELELSCRNTNTTVPYVDLVCEVLEGAVVPGGQSTLKPIASQRGAAELLAAPERVNDAAYTVLAGAHFPWTLPFDRPWATARSFLGHVGMPRHELMRRSARTADPSAETVAAEELGLSPADRELLVPAAPAQPWALWGMPAGFGGAAWFSALGSDLGLFVHKTGLEFDEVKMVLASELLNPGGIVRLSPEHACKIDDYDLLGLDDAFLERVRRFERLRRPMGWTIPELDAVLTALAPSVISDGSLLVQLAAVARLRRLAELDVLASFWAPISNASLDGRPSLWNRVFDAPAVRAAAPGVTAFDLSGGAVTGIGTILDHAPAVQAALSIRADELADLLAAGTTQPAPFSVQQLSRLHRHVRLARALRLPVASLLTLRTLWNTNPFSDPLATEAFVTAAGAVHDAGLKPDALALTFGVRNETILERDARRARQEPLVATLRGAVAAALSDAAPVPDIGGAGISALLTSLLSAADAATVMGLLAGTDGLSDAARRTLIDTTLGTLLNADRVAEQLIGPTATADPGERYGYLLGQFAARDRARAFVVQQLAAAHLLDPGVAELLGAVLPVSAGVGLPDAFLAPDFLASTAPVDESSAPALFASLTRLERIAALLSPFQIGADALTVVLRRAAAGRWLDVASLPTGKDIAGATGLFVGWLMLGRLLGLMQRLGNGEPVLRAIDFAIRFDETTASPAEFALARTELIAELTEVPTWPIADLEAALGVDGLQFDFPTDLRTVESYERLALLLDASARLGISPAALRDPTAPWVASTVNSTAAEAIRHAVAARHEPGDWPAVARPLQDELRIGQRDALVAYLCEQQGRTPDDLFGRYLIDVEMDPCQLTSRIKQAISSAQLLVQRGLLNLEPGVKLTAAQARAWRTWMHSYRIWQANRKVFLYPENWIEPELRDDKTPLFKELEDALQQGDVTDAAVENAYRTYVDGLHQLGGLEIVGSHIEQGGGPDEDRTILHLFGRTRGKPHQLYYRACTDYKSWSPWEHVPVEVTADQVAPAVFNRRLYVFWLIPERKAQQRVASQNRRDPEYYWDVTLAFSERRNGNWTSKRLSTSKLTTDFYVGGDQDSGMNLAITIDQVGTVSGAHTNARALISAARGGGYTAFENTAQMVIKQREPALFIQCVCELNVSASSYTEWTDAQGVHHVESSYSQNRDVVWVGRWRLGGCEEEPQITWARRSGGPAAPTPQPYEWPRDTSSYRAARIRPDDAGGAVRIVENATVATAGAPREVTLLSRSTLGSHLILRADHERYPLSDTFFFADLSHTYLVRGGWVVQPFWFSRTSVDVASALTDFTVQRELGRFTRRELEPPQPVEVVGWMSTDLARGTRVNPTTRSATFANLADFQTIPAPIDDGISTALLSPVTAVIGMIKDDARYQIDPLIVVLPRLWRYTFTAVHHPWTCMFVKALDLGGVPALLTLETQYPTPTGGFAERYRPTAEVEAPYPTEDLEFGAGGVAGAAAPFGVYDWELFFHAPLLLASRLSADQRFEDAQRWFHYVFDPTTGPVRDPASGTMVTDWRRAWRFRPFFEAADKDRSIEFLEALLHRPTTDPGLLAERDRFLEAVDAWRADPFKPHLVARFRPSAYQRNVVARYIRNLLAWGDYLFARDTIESINEATQLYVMAAELLGERPVDLPPAPDVQTRSFRDLEPTLDAFSNAIVAVEGALVTRAGAVTQPAGSNPDAAAVQSLISSLYFCVSRNSELMALWDTVADRLYKVRHCMNLEGVVRQLPLFEPAIDPALLVRAAAAGLSLDGAVAGLGAALPSYRFGVMAAKASELCNEVRGLGSALLGALERRDAEALAQLRAGQERSLLNAIRRVRLKQIEDAEQAIKTLEAARKTAEERLSYFSSREKSTTAEIVAHDALIIQAALRAGQGLARLLAGSMHALPNFTVGAAGWAGSPVATATLGGGSAAGVAGGIADGIGILAEIAGIVSTQASFNAANDRRWDDWQHQVRLATAELDQADQQTLGTQIRLAVAERELANHDVQIEQSAAFAEFLRTKFTNKQLFDWMVGQVAALYFQAYQLALTTARQAERCYQYELASKNTFVAPDSWDSLRKGLLAGDRLQRDLKRMESDYLATNAREHELTKHVSLSLRNPVALEQLRTSGRCEFELPEWMFDFDHPGQYLRRIKTVSLTLPAVVGPYTNVNARLTLLHSEMRISAELAEGKYLAPDPSTDPRMRSLTGALQSVATSRGQSDSGLFELTLKDERYLPFEGAGVVSGWRIELDPDCNDFDLSTLADAILELRYTARDGGDALRNACKSEVVLHRPSEGIGPLVRMFSVRTELSDAWHAFLYPPTSRQGQQLVLNLSAERFPYRARRGSLELTDLRIALLLDPKSAHLFPPAGLAITVTAPDGVALPPLAPATGLALEVGSDPALPGLPGLHVALAPAKQPGRWTVDVSQATIDALPAQLLSPAVSGQRRRLRPDAFSDILLFQTYTMLA